MNGDPDIHELARHVAVLEERMNTKQAEYEGAIDRLRANVEATLHAMQAEAAKRETRMLLAIAGLMIGIGGLAVAFLAFLIGLPG